MTAHTKCVSTVHNAAGLRPEVSVVLTVFNHANFCRAAIDSIVNQTLESFELIIINDGSTDETADIVDACAALDRRIRPFHTPNCGVAAARNLGILLARAKLIACMDGDDILLPRRLEKQTRFLNRHPNVGVVGGQMTIIGADGKLVRHVKYPTLRGDLRRAILRYNPIGFSTATMRRKLAIGVGGFRSVCAHASDYDLWLRTSEQVDIANLSETVVAYRWHGENTTARFYKSVAWKAELARLAARARREGRPDPLEIVAQIDKSTLDLFDLDASERVRLLRLWVAAKEEADLQQAT